MKTIPAQIHSTEPTFEFQGCWEDCNKTVRCMLVVARLHCPAEKINELVLKLRKLAREMAEVES